jgi:hypothetical protein
LCRCYACDEVIHQKDYVFEFNKSFHMRHFCCAICDVSLTDTKTFVPIKKKCAVTWCGCLAAPHVCYPTGPIVFCATPSISRKSASRASAPSTRRPASAALCGPRENFCSAF